MTHDRLAGYLEKVAAAQLAHPEWRSGQTHFNVLYELDPDAAEAVWTTPFDPFYRDDRVRFLLAFLRTRWGGADARTTGGPTDNYIG